MPSMLIQQVTLSLGVCKKMAVKEVKVEKFLARIQIDLPVKEPKKSLTKFEKLELLSQVFKLIAFTYLIGLWTVHVIHQW